MPTPNDPIDSSARPRLARHVRMSFDRSRGRHVLLRPETITVLNPTGADILSLCDGERTLGEIVKELQERYDRVVDDDVGGFLARLVAKRCVEIVE